MQVFKPLSLALAAAALCGQAMASSHREAPFITEMPKVDGTDFYMFNSYETGRAGFVTLIANYLPLQDAYGGPNYFSLDPDALYEIHISNDEDPTEEITFQFRFKTEFRGIALDVGTTPANTKSVAIPLINAGGITAGSNAAQNVLETYTVDVVRNGRRSGNTASVVKASGGSATFEKPVDNIGNKSIADYNAYANSFIHNVTIPGCAASGAKVFVGQRAEGFPVNLGQVFDLVNADFDPATPAFNPAGDMDQGKNIVDDKNITSIALEVPASCLNGANTKIGGWTTASLRQARLLNPVPKGPVAGTRGTGPSKEGGAWTQVSRLGMPLVNEVVIGITDKDKFNASHPSMDGQFADYVTNPTLPELLQILFPTVLTAPNAFPRNDLVTAFLTGVPGVNDTSGVGEMLRLNTGIPATAVASQNPLGAAACFTRSANAPAALNLGNAGCDPAGFPNGRRPGDDVVDIELRVAMGFLLSDADAPSGGVPLVDGAFLAPTSFRSSFPYLNTPIPGSP